MSNIANERRKSERFQLNQLIKLSFSKEAFIKAEGINISEEGILCRTEEYIAPHSVVYMLFSIPIDDQMKEITCEGIAVWSEDKKGEYKLGIKFLGLKQGDKNLIKRYLSEVDKK